MPNESPSNEAHLARIRDNQRRSRARRKEYLSELESKWRTCEQRGAEASAELQAVARRVLDENKRLRALLRSKGTAEDEIDDYVTSEMFTESAPPSAILANVLANRKICSSSPDSRKGSCGDILPQSHNNVTGSAGSVQPRPSSMFGTAMEDHELRQLPASPIGFAQSNLTSPTTSMYTPSMANYPYYERDANLIIHPNAQLPHHAPSNQGHSLSFVDSAATTHTWPAWQSTGATDPNIPQDMNDQNFTDCKDAASVIRSMSTVQVGHELEADLGCADAGVRCKVENNRMFDALDKYSGLGSTTHWG